MEKIILLLSFLLFNSYLSCTSATFNSYLSLTPAAEQPNPVRDIDGKEVRTGVEYYILPILRPGGGVSLGKSLNASEICPLTVIQTRLGDRGSPVAFTPVNPKKGVIRVSTDLNIKFTGAGTICINSNVWKLSYAEEIGQYVILTDGVEGNPGQETIENWFKIEEYHDVYKLVFCPTVCDFCKPLCRDVGIYFDEDGTRRLALSDTPFGVFFVKA